MKKLLLLLWLFPAVCLAQTDSAQVKPHYIYCKIFMISSGFLPIKFHYKADFGKKSSSIYFSDTEYRKLNEQLANFNSDIDALNYMDLQGWEFMTATPYKDAPIVEEANIYLLRKQVSR